MVRNHAEQKRGKERMMINYKKLNDNTVFDGYYIFNKIVLFNRIQGVSWFSKMDCKSRYWQIEMVEENIPLTTFSTPQGHYEWIVMSFGLKMHLKYSKEEWITSSKILITVIQFTSMISLSFPKPQNALIMALCLIKIRAFMLNKKLNSQAQK